MDDSRRRFSTRSGSFSQRAYGALLLVFGLIAIITPFSAGGWAISILGLIVLLAGVVEVIQGLRTQSPSSTWATYLTGVLMILGGLLLFARPVMVIGGLLALLALIVAVDGVTKIVSVFKDKLGPARWWTIFNGIVNLLLALLIWRQGASTGAVVLGVGLGLYIMSTGWTALFAPDKGIEDVDVARATNEHPDERLGLPPHAEFGRLRAAAVERELAALPIDAFWIIVHDPGVFCHPCRASAGGLDLAWFDFAAGGCHRRRALGSARRRAAASRMAQLAAAYAAHRTARLGTSPLGSDQGERFGSW